MGATFSMQTYLNNYVCYTSLANKNDVTVTSHNLVKKTHDVCIIFIAIRLGTSLINESSIITKNAWGTKYNENDDKEKKNIYICIRLSV